MADGAGIGIGERLLREREALLDLSTRNRLLNTPLRLKQNRAIEIVGASAPAVFRLLTSGRALDFRASATGEEAGEDGIVDEADEEAGEPIGSAPSPAASDRLLQTRLGPEALQKRLFDIADGAATLEEEQGVNILYLAVGLLRWFDDPSAETPRHAPLILLPVRLERSSAADRFRLKGRDEPPSVNLTLQAKMRADFGVAIPDFPDEDEVDVAAYCAEVAAAVADAPGWAVLPDALVLGFFSFAKFLMYRDLDPETWPDHAALPGHPLVSALLGGGFPESAPLAADDEPIDHLLPPGELNHVVDADSSQTVAIAEAAAGRTLVIKGPPGTGKSQTITNIIAAAVARGRKVLFVAEKMAALQVVQGRLQEAGLGSLILELHSHKVSKRTVLEELRRTRDAAAPSPPEADGPLERLAEITSSLNDFARHLHTPIPPCGLTPHAILGRLASGGGEASGPALALDGAGAWTRAEVEARRRLVGAMDDRAAALGAPSSHPWRGVRGGPVDPTERARLAERIGALRTRLDETAALARPASELLGAPAPRTLGDLRLALAHLAVSPLPPGVDLAAATDRAWRGKGLERLVRLVEKGRAYSEAWAGVAPAFNAAGEGADLKPIRSAVAAKGAKLLRFLDAAYREQMALFRSYLTGRAPKGRAARLALLDRMIAAQKARAAYEKSAAAGEAFGEAWDAEAPDWPVLERIVRWRARHAELPAAVWPRLAALQDARVLEEPRTALTASLEALEGALGAVFGDLRLDLGGAFGVEADVDIGLDVLAARLDAWSANLEAVSGYVAFATAGAALAEAGGGALFDALEAGAIRPGEAAAAFERAYDEALRAVLFEAWPELKGFEADGQAGLVAEFRRLDAQRLRLSRQAIRAAHAAARPKTGSAIGPLGVLNGEFARKRGHLPIRVLLDKAGPAIQQLKPVFMMSPLSVAQYLKPGGLTFDLLVMDEASQIEPVDALGAVARADQLVVVGDERQLPPTAFFKALTGDVPEEEDDEQFSLRIKDVESILELALAKGAPHRMLNWHYRSRHQSLIAVSNREFYDGRLQVVPSPFDSAAGLGLKFNLLHEAVYDRGGSRTNPEEARRVAEAVIEHARRDPGHSLGVATFSVAQRQAILKALERLRRGHPELEPFFSPARPEPFFVKNLENVQGDERDVIFISVGYGRAEDGKLAHAFGPLSAEGGERRLNVLISRAKLRCEVFCNFRGEDIDLSRTSARGVAALKLFLTYAETGRLTGPGAVAEAVDAIEEGICARLEALGCEVRRGVGEAGFRVDVAVVDPERPERFLLGLETDGPQFAASRSARDRDRLRQEVLESHGWRVHRVWSPGWWLRPEHELGRIQAAIEAARSEWRRRDEGVPPGPEPEAESEPAAGAEPEATPDAPVRAEPPPTLRPAYREAVLTVDASVEPHRAPIEVLAEHVAEVVRVEGPVHVDEIAARVRTAWGLARAGARVRNAVVDAAAWAMERGLIGEGPFHRAPGQPVVVRDRSEVASVSLRRPEMLPPVEIDEAVLQVLDENFGARRDDLVPAVARAFGFAATSAQLRGVIADRLDRLAADEVVVDRGGLLVRGKPTA